MSSSSLLHLSEDEDEVRHDVSLADTSSSSSSRSGSRGAQHRSGGGIGAIDLEAAIARLGELQQYLASSGDGATTSWFGSSTPSSSGSFAFSSSSSGIDPFMVASMTSSSGPDAARNQQHQQHNQMLQLPGSSLDDDTDNDASAAHDVSLASNCSLDDRSESRSLIGALGGSSGGSRPQLTRATGHLNLSLLISQLSDLSATVNRSNSGSGSGGSSSSLLNPNNTNNTSTTKINDLDGSKSGGHLRLLAARRGGGSGSNLPLPLQRQLQFQRQLQHQSSDEFLSDRLDISESDDSSSSLLSDYALPSDIELAAQADDSGSDEEHDAALHPTRRTSIASSRGGGPRRRSTQPTLDINSVIARILLISSMNDSDDGDDAVSSVRHDISEASSISSNAPPSKLVQQAAARVAAAAAGGAGGGGGSGGPLDVGSLFSRLAPLADDDHTAADSNAPAVVPSSSPPSSNAPPKVIVSNSSSLFDEPIGVSIDGRHRGGGAGSNGSNSSTSLRVAPIMYTFASSSELDVPEAMDEASEHTESSVHNISVSSSVAPVSVPRTLPGFDYERTLVLLKQYARSLELDNEHYGAGGADGRDYAADDDATSQLMSVVELDETERSFRSDYEPNTGQVLKRAKLSLSQMRKARRELRRMGMLVGPSDATEDCLSESATLMTDMSDTTSYIGGGAFGASGAGQQSLCEDAPFGTVRTFGDAMHGTLGSLELAAGKLSKLSAVQHEATDADLSDDEDASDPRKSNALPEDDDAATYGTSSAADIAAKPNDGAVGFLSLLNPQEAKKAMPTTRAPPRAVGFLSLLDPSEVAKFEANTNQKVHRPTAAGGGGGGGSSSSSEISGRDTPYSSSDTIGRSFSDTTDITEESISDMSSEFDASIMTIHLDGTAEMADVTKNEWEAYRLWLRTVVKASQQEIDSDQQTPRMNIFLFFYRRDIPIEDITSRHISSEKSWRTQGRYCPKPTNLLSVPHLPVKKHAFGGHKTALWFLQKKVPVPPTSYRFQNICHQAHTACGPSQPAAKHDRKEFERAMLEGGDFAAFYAGNTDASLRAARIQWAIELIGKKRTNPAIRANCAKVLCGMTLSTTRESDIRPGASEVIFSNADVLEFILSQAQSGALVLYRTILPSELRIGHLLENGGYARIYQAKWHEQDVAVTMIHSHRFVKSAVLYQVSLMSMLHHENVLPLLGAYFGEDSHHLVTPLMKIGSLFEALEKKLAGLDDIEMKIMILLQIARGMEYLHSKHIILCNLSSRNILLERALHNVRIADFSRAHLAQGAHNSFEDIAADAGWMAPELLAGEDYTESADVYSFGIIAWEMTTNKVPFAGVPLHQIHQKVIDGVRPEILKSCPTELRTLMEECWREPENRPSFRQLIRVLTDFGRSLRRATVV